MSNQKNIKMKQNLFMWMLLIASVINFSSCSKDNDDNDEGNNSNSGLSQTEITLKVGQSMTLSYGNGECTWSSEQPLIAEVDNNGKVTANIVGVTNIKANDDICKVTVTPNYNTYEEPYLKFGASIDEVKKAMSGYTLSSKTDAKNLVYIGKGIIDYYDYVFEDGELQHAAVLTNIFKGEETTDFLIERYIVVSVDKEESTILLTSIDMKVAIMVKILPQTGNIIILYAPFKDKKSISNKTIKAFDISRTQQHNGNQDFSKEVELFMKTFQSLKERVKTEKELN